MIDLNVNLPQPCGEKWETMRPNGCNRDCSVCETTVHDLSSITLEEAERLLDSEERVCVRAKIGPQGVVELAPSQNKAKRRMLAAVGTSLTLAIAACQSGAGSGVSPRFEISGEFGDSMLNGRAILEASNGRTYKRKLWNDRPFKIGNLPAGTYTLTISDYCGDPVTQKIVLSDADVDIGRVEIESQCIIIGVMHHAGPSRRS